MIIDRPLVPVSSKAVRRVLGGHPWVFSGEIERIPSGLEPGSLVHAVDLRGRVLGTYLYSSVSDIALRRIGEANQTLSETDLEWRMRKANDLRQRWLPGTSAYRVVHAESDALPGLVVDRYGDCLSVQLLCQAMDRLKDGMVVGLVRIFSPSAIVLRNDAPQRRLEGLPEAVEIAHGETDGLVPFKEGEATLLADLRKGQKTGAFLDQRDNHLALARYAGDKALDLFSYTGGFGIHLARKGASVTAVDSSSPALGHARQVAAMNGVADRYETVEANAFDFLRSAVSEGRVYDTVIIDPPPMARSRSEVEGARRGIKDLVLMSLRLMKYGGTLVLCSCSHHLGSSMLMDEVEAASIDVSKRILLLEQRGQPADHPILVGFPQSRYLTCLIFQVL